MLKKFAIAIAGYALVVLTLGAVKASQIKEMSSVSHVPPATAVTTYEARSVAWQPTINAIGTLAPVEGVTLAPDADGTIVKIAVENGAHVKAGDLVIELDTTVEEAQLAAAEARSALAKLQRDRAVELAAKNTISAAELDTATAQLNQATADVAAIKATIDKKHVRAPFDGRIGIRMVNLGQFVARGRAVVPLQKMDPIYVNFNVPQQQLAALKIGQPVVVRVDALPVPYNGTITAINSEVDSATRNIAVQATLANPEEQLRPGMFVQTEVELPLGPPQVVVPATAVAYAPYGNSVFVVETLKNADGSSYLGVRQQIVRVGATRGDLVAIESGLKPGEQVVTAGVFKLRNGAHVEVNNTVQPSASPTPKPANT
ncbi:MAG TPA: efflux RND transporter periplasmic adaptor subunit [Opitutaceae bacterium]|nr:efflux RND transporter periplasmic adaptor subunit [Opitutaceae bacterium]HND61649.1 efflux RND transporter periplasmic adaptor subunit [Opitutaceae bacterium]